MPSNHHEVLVEMLRARPIFAAELLVDIFAAPLPRFTEVRVEPADLGDAIPRELRADFLVLLLHDKPVLVIVVEVQLSFDPDKLYAWPAYIVGARARYRCPACLLVLTTKPKLARRLAQPITLGPGMGAITPFVLGPEGVPAVTNEAQAREKPELAVLSAMAHRGSLEVAMTALAACGGIKDAERVRLYVDLVVISVEKAVRDALEKMMALPDYEYQSAFARKYVAKGLKKGLEKGAFLLSVRIVERRLGRELSDDERATLRSRIHELGIDPVSDLVLDRSPEELASWLGAPSPQKPKRRSSSKPPRS